MKDSRPMGHRRLGRAGIKVSEYSLGGWLTFGKTITTTPDAKKLIHQAKEAGINFFDIADVYANGEAERVMGRVFADMSRHELVLSSKLFWPASEDINDRGLSRKHIMESVERSLTRLGTDYLDLYFCHRFDPDTPIEETARAMDDLVHQGKILYWGTSEWTGDQLRQLSELCDRKGLYRPVVEQPQYSLIERRKVETDVGPAASDSGMGLVVWSPLGSGMLTGKYDQGVPAGSRLAGIDWLRDSVRNEANIGRVKAMKSVADELGCTRAQLALAWAAAQPNISSVILGASDSSQLAENLGALSVTITPEVTSRLDAIFAAA